MVEALVSMALECLDSIIRQLDEAGIRFFWVAELKVEKFKSNLLSIQAVLADAEIRQLNDYGVRNWLNRINRIDFYIDHVLDAWNMKLQKLRIKKAEYASDPLKKVCSLIPHHLCCFNPYFLHYDNDAEIISLESELDDIAKDKNSFDFSSIKMDSKELEQQMTTSFFDEDEKNKIINFIGTNNMISVSRWSKEKCWSVFSQLALSGNTNKVLEAIGKKIVQKCKGIPLAVKLLGSLLCFKREIKEWKYILDSEIWEIQSKNGELNTIEQTLLASLLLSYHDLPPMLKRCLLYCAMFSKDNHVQKDHLIKLWIAQDYIRAKENKDIELVGEEYFEILAMRSFFQDFKKDEINNSIKSFKLYDIVHDFAEFLTNNECLTKEVYLTCSNFPLYGVRHLMLILGNEEIFPKSIYAETYLRCLVVKWDGIATKIDLSNLFDNMIYLRTLDLSGCSLKKLHRRIKKLIHLRYLNLSANDIEELPETLCELYNLQTLDLTSCRSLKKLPQGMGKLINLRHLLNSHTPLNYMPKSVERLTNLRTLSQFVISDGRDGSKSCSLACLKNFNHLRDIGIDGLGNVKHVGEAEDAKLNNKKNLHTLDLSFIGRMNEEHEIVLEALQPPSNLMELRITDYSGSTILPNWMMSLTKLRRLSLCDCVKCEHLPPLGKLSSLEILEIWSWNSVKRVGNEFLGTESDMKPSSSSVIYFPKLKYLSFEFMREWEEWNYDSTNRREEEEEENVTIMPCLEILKIFHCYKLKSLPNHLYKMTTLKKDIYKLRSTNSVLWPKRWRNLQG